MFGWKRSFTTSIFAAVLALLPSFLPAQQIIDQVPQAGRVVPQFGWAGPEAAAEARRLYGGQLPELRVYGGPVQTQGRYLGLWFFTRSANRGEHLPNVPQEIGDCVSFGNGHAVEYSHATLTAVTGQGKFRRVFKPYIYGTSRVQVGGGRLSGDGSTGAWAAAALQRYGVIAEDDPGVPRYSGSIAKRWGAQGPPREFLELGKANLCEARLVTTWDQLCQAIANGWPVAVCSNAGFRCSERNGRVEGTWNQTWLHCMGIVGFDARPGKEAGCCLNSWGPNAHAQADIYARLDGSPPGSFWIRKPDLERMLKQGDSYAISFNGFQRNDLLFFFDSKLEEVERARRFDDVRRGMWPGIERPEFAPLRLYESGAGGLRDQLQGIAPRSAAGR